MSAFNLVVDVNDAGKTTVLAAVSAGLAGFFDDGCVSVEPRIARIE